MKSQKTKRVIKDSFLIGGNLNIYLWHLYLNVKCIFLEGELYIEGEEGFWVLRRGGEPEYTRV